MNRLIQTRWCWYPVLAAAGLSACSTSPPQPSAAAAEPPTENRRIRASGWVASADDVRIRYHQSGAGPVTIVFVHGWLCDSRYWRLQVPAFEDRYRVITLDLAGHGESGFGRERWTMQSFAADVAAVVHATEADRIVLVGHSMGGPVVVEAARLLGDKVIGVIGVDTLRMSDPLPADQRAEAFSRLQADFVNTVRDYVATTMFVATSDPQLRDSIATDMAEGPPVVGLGAAEGLLAYPAAESLGRLDKPFVLINSDYQPTDSERVRAAAPQARIETMSGAGHFLMLEKPAEFNVALDRTIRQLIAGTATSRAD